MDITADAFPQLAASRGGTGGALPGAGALPDFRSGYGAVFYVPQQVTDVALNERGARLTCRADAYENRLTHTHETAYTIQTPAGQAQSMVVDVAFWTDRIFRVTLTRDGCYRDPYERLPADCRMLVGQPGHVQLEAHREKGRLRLTTPETTLEIDLDPFCLRTFSPAGNGVFSQRRPDTPTGDILPCSFAELHGEQAAFEALYLAPDEEIYGLGERFDSLPRRGRPVDFWNKDAIGTTSPRSYVNVPFFLSTRGYGLFLNSSAPTDWQIATADVSCLGFSVLDDQMDYFVLQSPDPKQILHDYCTLTGFAKMPPVWSFGLWMSRNSYVDWDMAEQVGKELRDHKIPCDVLHLDTAWFETDWNCDLRFSPTRFPDPEQHLQGLREQGFRVSLWQYNFIPPRQDNVNYIEACQKGYLAQDGDGNPYRLPPQTTGSWVDDVILDFTNPATREWYGGQIRRLMEMGASAIKTDFGEGIPTEARYHAVEGKYMHNLYPLPYNYTVWKATKEATGDDIVWARSGTAGSQRFPLHWGGDSQCTFDGMAGTLRAALSIGMSGIPFFSHDIGGFLGLPSPELYVRWAQFGLFCSHARCHGCGDTTYREPWRFGKEAEDIFRTYDELRYSLTPYLLREAEKCTRTGLPMVRSLYLEYPGDRNVRGIEDEYLFGDDFLVAPVLKPLSETAVREVYLPAGDWVDFWSRERIASQGMWISRPVDLATMPIYVKTGARIPMCDPRPYLGDSPPPIRHIETF